LQKKEINIRQLLFFGIFAMILAMFWRCATPRFKCAAYNEHIHQTLADTNDPSNSIKSYYHYPVLENGDTTASTSDSGAVATNMDEEELVFDEMKDTTSYLPEENEVAKEVEEEWKPHPYSFFNLRMEVDSLGKPVSYKPVNVKWNGMVDKKKNKKKNINMDKELGEDKKKSNYLYVEPEANLPQ
jgi:hypothetical protein